MNNEVIAVQNLTHTYKSGVTALNGVNLSINENEIISIIGQNGSGKTTLVRHFNGLLRPSSGRLSLFGQDTAKKSVSEMSHIVGYAFQNPNHQIFCTTVREELEVAPKNFKIAKTEYLKEIDRIVTLMGIGDILNKNPLMLDYTTKKIVTIASVLVANPKILVLDEPTGGLDEPGRIMLSEITRIVHEMGHTVIMISHDMDYVAEHSKRIIVMANGKIIAGGEAGQIFSDKQIMQAACIEPPQITQLDAYLCGSNSNNALSVTGFIDKYKTM